MKKAFTMLEFIVFTAVAGSMVFFAYQYFSKSDDTEAENIRIEIDNR